jgi:endonuclease/exonuclease/phosphatase (EEP) superfamily protein YafD
MSFIYFAYYILATFMLLTVVLPLLKSTWWGIRVLDYPRMQKLVLLLLLLIAWKWAIPQPTWPDYTFLGLLIAGCLYLSYVIWPYTLFGKKMIAQVRPGKEEKPLSILVCNVLQDNKQYSLLAQLIQKRQADIIFLLETDRGWQQALQEVVQEYKHRIEVPQDNTYGLLFYSKLPLLHHEVNFLIDREIPSIIADIDYYDTPVRLYGLHPTPPVPQENTESAERDAEILITGKMAKEYDKPCIVMGDLNDVAWSATTTLFLKSSELLDARRGRGMYNTFHAGYWFLRWPLDHFFVSTHFRLIDMKIEKNVKSDHFPISLAVVLRHDDDSGTLEIDPSEKQEVEEKIGEGIQKGNA